MELMHQIFAAMELLNVFKIIDGRTRFQKLEFLLDQKTKLGFDFKKSNYGPFSSRLYEIIDTLKNDGLIKEDSVESREHTKYTYTLTKKGKEALKQTRKGIETPDKITNSIRNLAKFNAMSLHELVGYVYENYPDFAGEFFKEK